MQSKLQLGLLHWQPALPGQPQPSSRWRSCLLVYEMLAPHF